MSLSALRDALALLLKTSLPPVELDLPAEARLPARSVGDIVQATVKAELVNGRSVIEIDGAPFDVKLPIAARAGDTLRLQVLALAPRLTLALLQGAANGTPDQVAMSESAQRLAAVLDQLATRRPDPASDGRIPGAAAERGATATRSPAASNSGRGGPTAPVASFASAAHPAASSTTSTQSALSAREAPVGNTFAAASSVPDAGTSVPGGSFTGRFAAATPTPAPAASSTPMLPAAAGSTARAVVTSEAAPLERAAPVLSAPHRDTAVFAAALKSALSRSGLFYESHQAQWVAGERPLPELMREPQASLSRGTEPVHSQAIGVVRQQLEILDTRQLVWVGQVWPDQSMEWRIEEDRRDASTAPEEPGVWKTSLRLTLPRLGAITASLSIRGDEARVAFREVSRDTGSAMAGEQQTLRSAFDRAGLQLVDVKVECDET